MSTETREKTETATELPPVAEAKGGQEVALKLPLRLPFPKLVRDIFNIDHFGWKVITEVIFPNAGTPESIVLALSYCKARRLDVMKRPIHIVPMYSKAAGTDGKGAYVDSIWPGIAEVRITATRTDSYAGKDRAVFGPLVEKTFTHEHKGKKEELTLTFPEWCEITVYRIVKGVRAPFVGPKVNWLEAYATKDYFSEIPNDMWASRASGQLEKCAEAGALRAAFPEELGNEYTAEEMQGQIIEAVAGRVGELLKERVVSPDGTMTPPRQAGSAFEREPAEPPGQAGEAAPERRAEATQTATGPVAGTAESAKAESGPTGPENAPSEASGQTGQADLPLGAPDNPAALREREWQDYRRDLHREIGKLDSTDKVDFFEDRHGPEFSRRPDSEIQEFKDACARRFSELRAAKKAGR